MGQAAKYRHLGLLGIEMGRTKWLEGQQVVCETWFLNYCNAKVSSFCS